MIKKLYTTTDYLITLEEVLQGELSGDCVQFFKSKTEAKNDIKYTVDLLKKTKPSYANNKKYKNIRLVELKFKILTK